jgi:flagellar biosynthesis protein FlhB
MAEEGGDKTEAPTPKRRQMAAEKGQVARSPDLVAAALIVGSMLLLRSSGMDLVNALAALLKEMLSARSFQPSDPKAAIEQLWHAFAIAGRGMFPLLAGIVLIATIGNVLQIGFRFNTTRIKPNLGAINPMAASAGCSAVEVP